MKDRGIVIGAIALVVVLSFCAFAIWIGLHPLPAANQHFLDIALGALVTQFANVCAYYFGSSRSAEQRPPIRPPATVPDPLPPSSAAPAPPEVKQT